MSQAHTPSAPLAEVYDVAVVGGGINGVGIAADAAGRGLSVFLCEQHDLAQHTSSASSKLIHGGLRYLEHYEFRLVREALAEREVLLAKAPHIVKPLRFVLPHRPHLRPAWMIRAGLFLYDHLGKREKLPASRGLRFTGSSPLKAEIRRGFEYSDCAVDDARLVVLNAISAREHGAHVHTRTRCVSARRSKGLWHLHLERSDGSLYSIRARALVNAAGPWVARFIQDDLKQKSPYGIRLIQGSHIIVPKLYEGEHAYILQNEDRRIVFAIPYLDRFTMIGTTDREYQGDPAKVAISEEETAYLLQVVNAHFKQQLAAADILHSFAGVRPLCDDESDEPSAITRDYTLSLSAGNGEPPLLSVFGGKLTTFRPLAVEVLQACAALLGRTVTDDGAAVFGACEGPLIDGLGSGQRRRLAGRYGRDLVRLKRLVDTLGTDCVGASETLWAELAFAAEAEMVLHLDDLLLRRTRLGLLLPGGGAAYLPRIRALCQARLGWDDPRWEREQQAYLDLWRRHYSLPV